MVFTAISGAISSISTTYELLTSAIEARDESKLKKYQTEMNTALFNISQSALLVQSELMAATAKCHELEKEIRNLKESLLDKENFVPFHFGTGAIAFINQSMHSHEKPVYYCAACNAEEKKTILQGQHDSPYLKCPLGHPLLEIAERTEPLVQTLLEIAERTEPLVQTRSRRSSYHGF